MLDNKKNIRYKLFRTTNARVAQLVEQRTENPRVGGSIPSPSTIHFLGFAIIGKVFFLPIFQNCFRYIRDKKRPAKNAAAARVCANFYTVRLQSARFSSATCFSGNRRINVISEGANSLSGGPQ